MNSSPDNKILKLPRRPAVGDASGTTFLSAIAGGILTGSWAGALAGGVIANAVASRKQPLEMAVRNYFAQNGLEVIFFQRAPRKASVGFRYAPGAFWTIESIMPDDLNLSPEDRDDWLYGNLVQKELPKVLRKISNLRRDRR